MNVSKQYLHDRLILLLASVNVFLAFVASLLVLFRLDSGRSAGYIVQYRGSLGISALKTGDVTELIAFIGFALIVAIVHIVLSIRLYPIKREISVLILGLGILLLIMSIIVSNALLALR